MSTASEISVVRVPLSADRPSDDAGVAPGDSGWTPTAVGRGRRPAPATLAALAVLSGFAALALGGLAVFWSARADDGPTASSAPPSGQSEQLVPSVEGRALALLAKPSTERVLFRGSEGRLVLAVGSGGRAALVLRGVEPAPAGRPYQAWVVGPNRAVRAAQFSGGERAVLLSVPVARGASVVIAPTRQAAVRAGTARSVATRP